MRCVEKCWLSKATNRPPEQLNEFDWSELLAFEVGRSTRRRLLSAQSSSSSLLSAKAANPLATFFFATGSV
jgi:hypothetical protein